MNTFRFSEQISRGLTLTDGGRVVVRQSDVHQGIAYSANHLAPDELFEVSVLSLAPHYAGTLCIGVTSTSPTSCSNSLPPDCCYITGKYKSI